MLTPVGVWETGVVPNGHSVSRGDSGYKSEGSACLSADHSRTQVWRRQQQQNTNFLFSRKFWIKYVTGMKTNEKLSKP